MRKSGDHNPEVNRLLESAKGLAAEKKDVYERIDASRSILRNYKKLGDISPEQSAAIDEFYPPVKVKAKDDKK